jgi:4-amino-4-deoxy-L-arabinose transferase-like glycosyltransferase
VPPSRASRCLLLLILVVAFALRLPAPGLPPPGLYHDEAYYGIDAAGVLGGDVHLYFPANNGREPLFIYLAAGFIAVLGHTPAALRLASAFVGTATVTAVFAAGRGLFDRRTALVAAALVAVAPWPVILGRVGLRAGMLPLVLALAIAATARARGRHAGRWGVLGGALAGLTLYTYVAARLLPVLAVAWALWRRATHRPLDRRSARRWLLAVAVVVAPLLLVFARAPGETLGRVGQVAVIGPGAAADGQWSALARNAVGTLGMFVVRGDFIPRHDIPDRPMLGAAAGLLWLIGLVVALRRILGRRSGGTAVRGDAVVREDGADRGHGAASEDGAVRVDGAPGGHPRPRDAAALLVAWLVVTSLPTLLAENAPHFLRAVGVLPAVMLLAGLGGTALVDACARRGTALGRVAAVFVVVAVLAEMGSTVGYARAAASDGTDERLYYAFETGATALAADINRALGRGWQDGWAAGGAPDRPGRAVWLDRRLRDGWAAVPYLVPTERLTLTDPYDPVLTSGPGVAFLWPHDLDRGAVWSKHPPGLRLAFTEGTRERGDLEPDGRLLYVRVDATAAEPVGSPVADFADGVVLVTSGLTAGPSGRRLVVETDWEVRRPVDHAVTAFVQVLDGDRQVAGSDVPLGGDYLPVPFWRVGDRIADRRVVELPLAFDPSRQRVIAGLYEWPSLARIPVVDAAGQPGPDHVTLAP